MSDSSPGARLASRFPPRRPVQAGIAPTRAERDGLHRAVERYVGLRRPVPPLSFAELDACVQDLIRQEGTDPAYAGYLAVLLNNEVWREALAAVPFDRRLLLLPQCLRDLHACRAKIDSYGLLCAHCGACPLDELIRAAEHLGYAVLVAEGITVVTELIRSGRIQAVVGVSCLESLEKVYPLIQAAAVPAAAIPLLQDGCAETAADLDRLWEAIHLHRRRTARGDLDCLREQVARWFEPAALAELLGPAQTRTEEIAQQWLAGDGKRWRPLLTACAYAALADGEEGDLPRAVRHLGVAVECFHKASLIHDDIEDEDPQRYGQLTLHRRHGVPVALNAGDLLLGEGYRLIGQCPVGEDVRGELLRAAARGHRDLCRGQGLELCWLREPRPLTVEQVVEIFRLKTAPAFGVALRFGALLAGAGRPTGDLLDAYSEHLGIAYQVRDDLEDFQQARGDSAGPQPSVLLSLAHQAAGDDARRELASTWCLCPPLPQQAGRLRQIVTDSGAELEARKLLRHHVRQALAVLEGVRAEPLKRLLRQALGRVFCDVQAQDLRELLGPAPAAADAAGRSAGAGP